MHGLTFAVHWQPGYTITAPLGPNITMRFSLGSKFHMDSASIQSLAQRLKASQDTEPKRFIFFLGAGTSESSGIPTASWMMQDFRRRLKELWESENRPHGNFQTWLRSKPGWARNKSAYARFFEAHEPSENGRVRYLNKWMEAALPGWGYFCLAQLLARSYIGTIVTSNFDDLIYESCTQNSVRRPRVYSTLSPYASSVEPDHRHPTIIKLHGDYLYRNIKNTTTEMQNLDRRLMANVSDLFQTHEIIVAGYSGTDNRIMDDLFAKVPPANAVYWCTYKDEPVPRKVEKILSSGHHDRWFKVRIEGFDDFMDELFNQLDFSFPSIVQPIQAIIDAIPGRIEGSNSRYMEKYLDEAIQQVQREEEELAQAHGVSPIPKTPYRLRLEAMHARINRDFSRADDLYGRLITLANQDTCEVLIEYAVTLELMDKYSQAVELIPRIEKNIHKPDDLGNCGWLLANLGRYDDGIKYFNLAIAKAPGMKQWQAGLAMILSENGQIDEALNYAQDLTEKYPTDGSMWAARSMIESLAGNYAGPALKYAAKAVDLSPKGLVENLSLAFAKSGSGDHQGAISALEQAIGEEDDIRYRCLGHFQILAGDGDSAVENLKKSVDLTKPALRPKTLALQGVALLSHGASGEGYATFESAWNNKVPNRNYRADDEFAFALCEMGVGQWSSGLSKIEALSKRYRAMRGLLLELSALLAVMKNQGVEGCGQSIATIQAVLSEKQP